MRKELRALFVAVLLATPIVALPYSAAARPKDEKSQRGEPKNRQTLYKEVRHQLVMLPWYSVFDNLAYMRASQVPNVFSVKNNLVVAS